MLLSLSIFLCLFGYFSYVLFYFKDQQLEPANKRFGDRLERLWDDAFISIKSNKFLRAEKSLLTILKFDERNAGAYNRLGILYAKQRSFEHAIECFEIAQSLEPNASTLHNLGLTYMEIGELQKSMQTFELALADDDQTPTRYIAYAKVLERLGHDKKMVEALEKAAKLLPNKKTYLLVVDAYRKVGRDEDADKIERAMKRAARKIKKAPRIKQPRKVVM